MTEFPARTKTLLIADYTVTLTAGRRYRASRPMRTALSQSVDVTIQDITDGADAPDVLVSSDLSYEQADAFIREFNNSRTHIDGRLWRRW